jgi:serine/threonine-protein kinase
MAPALAVAIALQIADGLLAIHARDIVHRDLKPGNVFLVRGKDDEPHVKLLDFGIGRQASESASITGEHDIIGTVEYMTPEQASGRTARVDHRGDQFALGIIIYEMLTGDVPFTGDNLTEVLHKIQHEAPVRPSTFGIPADFDGILLQALAKSPSERFASVREFAIALAGIEHAFNVRVPVCFGAVPRGPRLGHAATEQVHLDKPPTQTGVRRRAGAVRIPMPTTATGRWAAASSDRRTPSGRYAMSPSPEGELAIEATSPNADKRRF